MKNKLDILSDMTGSGKSTVSKAIRHCFGVDPMTREQILMTAREMGIGDERKYSIYFILPDRPSAFWTSFMGSICSELSSLDVKFNVYPPDSTYVLGDYLEEARRSGARIIVSCARPNERQYELLCEAAKELPIIFLFDRVDIKNTFFIGTDAYSDGRALASMTNVKSCSRILVLGDGSKLSNERISGFSACADVDIVYVELPEGSTASEIARAVSFNGIGTVDCIYSTVHQVREAALAVIKLGLRGRCTVMGHSFGDEPFISGDINGVPYICICPDHERICKELIGTLKRYAECRCLPDRKYTIIQSER